MPDISGVSPTNPSHNNPIQPSKEPDPNAFKNVQNAEPSGTPPQTFAQTSWGFDAAEAKKFLENLANFIIAQIKHEDDRAKETMEKLKQSEEGEEEST